MFALSMVILPVGSGCPYVTPLNYKRGIWSEHHCQTCPVPYAMCTAQTKKTDLHPYVICFLIQIYPNWLVMEAETFSVPIKIHVLGNRVPCIQHQQKPNQSRLLPYNAQLIQNTDTSWNQEAEKASAVGQELKTTHKAQPQKMHAWVWIVVLKSFSYNASNLTNWREYTHQLK